MANYQVVLCVIFYAVLVIAAGYHWVDSRDRMKNLRELLGNIQCENANWKSQVEFLKQENHNLCSTIEETQKQRDDYLNQLVKKAEEIQELKMKLDRTYPTEKIVYREHNIDTLYSKVELETFDMDLDFSEEDIKKELLEQMIPLLYSRLFVQEEISIEKIGKTYRGILKVVRP